MNNIRLPQLRIKVKSLAVEAKLIKSEERRELKLRASAPLKHKGQHLRNYWSLYFHRQRVVGKISRESFLVMGFLKGRCRQEIEKSYNESKYWLKDTDKFYMGVDLESLHEAIGRFMRTSSVYKKPSFEQVSKWMKQGNVFYDGNKLLDVKFKNLSNTSFLKESA